MAHQTSMVSLDGPAPPVPASPATPTRSSPRKRASSFVGFFSRILPSNRPEQGGTLSHSHVAGADRPRRVESRESAYVELGIDPNGLTEWNLPQDEPLRPVVSNEPNLGYDQHRHIAGDQARRSGRRESKMARHAGNLHVNGQQKPQPFAPPIMAPMRGSDTVTRSKIRAELQARERRRKDRRSLKDSGDWLGVTGADPDSGQFPVLTPTDTISSDATKSSTENRLQALKDKKEAAKLAYERTRLEEEVATEKAKLMKDKSKLDKIERVKGELRRKQRPFATKWSRHQRHWSSAIEPTLSPIPQSARGSLAIANSELAERPSLNPQQPSRPGHRAELSSETVIRKRPTEEEQGPEELPIEPATKLIALLSPDQTLPDVSQAKSAKPFLWMRRRRALDPGQAIRDPVERLTASATDLRLMSGETLLLTPNHFVDVTIPDCHLHLNPTEPQDLGNTALPSVTDYQSPNPMLNHRQTTSEGLPTVLAEETNRTRCQSTNSTFHSRTGSEATVISSLSRLRWIMKPRSGTRKRILGGLRRSPSQEMKAPQALLQNTREQSARSDDDLSGDTMVFRSERLPVGPSGRISPEWASKVLHHMESSVDLALKRESASTHTITTTGFDHGLWDQRVTTTSRQGVQSNHMDGAGDDMTGAPAKSTSADVHQSYTASIPRACEGLICSPPTIPQSRLRKIELAPKTAETDSPFVRPVTAQAEELQDTKAGIVSPHLESEHTIPEETTVVRAKVNLKGEVLTLAPLSDHGFRTEEEQVMEAVAGGLMKSSMRNDRENSCPTKIQNSLVLQTGDKYQEIPCRPVGQSVNEHKEAIVQAAARIAVLRSRAKEIAERLHSGSRSTGGVRQKVSTKDIHGPPKISSGGNSSSISSSKNQKRNPMPGSPKTKESSASTKTPEKKSVHDNMRKKSIVEDGSEDTGVLSEVRALGPGQNGKTARYQRVRAAADAGTTLIEVKKNWKPANSGDKDEIEEADAVVTISEACKTAYLVVSGLACAWWSVVRPALDRRSALWRRRRRRRSTWTDVGVFVCAGASSALGLVAAWLFVGRVVFWAVGRL